MRQATTVWETWILSLSVAQSTMSPSRGVIEDSGNNMPLEFLPFISLYLLLRPVVISNSFQSNQHWAVHRFHHWYAMTKSEIFQKYVKRASRSWIGFVSVSHITILLCHTSPVLCPYWFPIELVSWTNSCRCAAPPSADTSQIHKRPGHLRSKFADDYRCVLLWL